MWIKQTLIALTFLLPLGLLTLSNAGGRATVQGAGNTGAPGETSTCSQCHNANNFGVSLNVELINSNSESVTEYFANTAYRLRVTVNSSTGSPAKYAMQLLTLLDTGNTPDNDSYANPSSNAKIVNVANLGRTYVEQVGPSSSNIFEVDWTAPETGSGSITFYSAGLAVNGNGGTSGDGHANTSLSISESTSSTRNILNKSSFKFTNPVTNELSININDDITIDRWQIFDINGRLIQKADSNSSSILNINTDNYENGIYFIRLHSKESSTTLKFVKTN